MNRGQGDALRTGFEIALAEGAEIVMTMDADGQHQVSDIAKLVQPIVDGEADYVMGSRFLGEYEDRGGFRHAGIMIFTVLLNLFTRARITDCTNGFRAIRASSLTKLELHEDRFSAPELIIEAVKKGLRIREVPVHIARRAAGESKKPRQLEYPLGFLRAMLQTWLR
jgi:glycosyltransferase involved in cell wall biosynthesis